jgi:signal transduction histidine kinase/ActR/RegA family two-component response regulator
LLGPLPPTALRKRTFALLAAAYCALVLALLPWAGEMGLQDPRIAGVSGTAILFANLCTALLLGAWYRSSGRAPHLVLTGAYLYGGIMAGLHMASSPGALLPQPLFSGEQTAGWILLGWHAGLAGAYLAAVLLEVRGASPTRADERGRRLVGCCLLALGASALAGALAASVGARPLAGLQWAAANLAIIWICVAVCGAALAVIWARRAFDDALYLWLALVLVAKVVGLVLGNVDGGGRYTIAWHASWASDVVSAFLLLVFLMREITERLRRPLLSATAAAGGAIAAAGAAVFLRWSLDPWLGPAAAHITLFGAVAIAVWLGGWAPATLSAVLGYAAVSFLFSQEPGGSAAAIASQVPQALLFTLTCATVIGTGEGMRRARDRYRTSEVALEERALQLQRADANKSHFLALLAHELRNPLAPMRTGLAVLKLSPDAASAARTHEMMERQFAQLTRLIDDLLDVSRIDRGKLELRPERMALEAVARSAVEAAMPGMEAKSLQLVVRYAGQPLYVEADPVRLAQVLGNLLNNAAKFTATGGRIELAMRAEDGHAVASVADTGVGLAPADLEKIFDMFVQVGAPHTSGGLGLGLTLVRSIVEHHGGRVEARSAGPGRGAEFVVRLPLAPSAAAATAPAVALPANGARRRVLVVDDNIDAAETIANLLRLEGHRVETAFDGAAAVRVSEALQPDIAFIDLNMPVMDGYELARRLRTLPFGRSIRLVALTGIGKSDDLERTRAAGFDLHITKPADPAQVSELAAGTSPDNVVRLHDSDVG